jgi:hypothetical protein
VVSSGPYTVTSSDELIVVPTGAFTINLPGAIGSGRLIWVKYFGTGTLTVDASSSETIDDELVQTLLNKDCLMISDYTSSKWAVL